MRRIEPEALSEAALIGAKRYGHESGHTYWRRRLTSKQCKLLVLLADGDAVGTDELAQVFPAEWNAILTAHPDREMALQCQALFENLADVASRINAYLLAGYKDSLLRARMVTTLGGQLVAIATSFAEREMWTVGANDLNELLPVAAVTESNRRRAQKPPAVPTHPTSQQALPQPPDQSKAAPPAPPPDPLPKDVISGTQPASEVPTDQLPQPAAPQAPSPMPPPPPQPEQPALETIPATVNPVTRRWTLHLPEGEIEADPRLAIVRWGSTIRRWSGDPLPEDPEALTAEQLARLQEMLS